jgi:hypothetical protein
MMNDDTVRLLRECNEGIKMAVSSIEDVLPSVKSEELKQHLVSCKHEHEKLGNETHSILNKYDVSGKGLSPIAQGMSWVKTNVRLTVRPTDNTVADLMTEGCSTGVKSLHKFLNQYQVADNTAKDITERLIRSEEQLLDDLKPFL